MWTAGIIAGGAARRFGGRDKGSLMIGRHSILERQLHVLRQVADHILIVANDCSRAEMLGLPVVADLIRGAGSLGGIYTAISSAPTERTLVVACDMPFLSAEFLRHLMDAGRTADIAVPRTAEGYQPLCATYSRACARPMRGDIDAGVLKLGRFIAAAHGLTIRELGPAEIAPFDAAGMLFFNINTPDDHARALELLAQPGTDAAGPKTSEQR